MGKPTSLRIAHISDLHFGPPFLPVVADSLLSKIGELAPDLIVVSGDLTQRAKPHQFEAAAKFLDRMPPVPRLVIPGNHDVPLYRVLERFRDPHGHYRRLICNELNPVLQVDGAVIVGLDTTSPYRNITNGRINTWQLDMCSDVFERAPADAARIVVAHHHFAPAPDRLHDWSMPKASRAIDRFVELGVEMILGGHLHRAYIGNSLDFFPGEHRERGIIIVQSGTTTSRRGRGREREKNSFNLINVTDTTHDITHFIYFNEEHGFTPFSRHIFPRPGGSFEHDVLHASSEQQQPQSSFEVESAAPI